MTASFTTRESKDQHSNVRHWTRKEACDEMSRIERKIEDEYGMSIADLRHRGSEWDLEPKERKILAAYERFSRMVNFANDGGI